jgi:hypothetical protein
VAGVFWKFSLSVTMHVPPEQPVSLKAFALSATQAHWTPAT